jgi:D-glycero-D-manno-heptose 1,7-bisphosphate phosphatase
MSTDSGHCVLLDRDGVINRDLPGSVCSTSDFELLPGAGQAIAEMNRKGYHVLVITNQACVGRGDLSPDGLEAIHLLLQRQLAGYGGRVERFYVCPHTDADDCDCRKPRTGLIDRARADYGFEPAATWLIGDSARDIEAALRSGCRPGLVRTGKGMDDSQGSKVAEFVDLLEFAGTLRNVRHSS